MLVSFVMVLKYAVFFGVEQDAINRTEIQAVKSGKPALFTVKKNDENSCIFF